MNRHPLVIALCLIGTVVLLVFWFALGNGGRPTLQARRVAEQARRDFGKGWALKPVDPGRAEPVAKAVSQQVLRLLKELPREQAEALAADVTTAVMSILARDVTPWRDAVFSRGMTWENHVEATTRRIGERTARGRSVPAAQWDAWSVERRFEWMWAHPEDRHAAIEAVDVSSVRAAVGLGAVSMPPGGSGPSVKSFFCSPHQAALARQMQQDRQTMAAVAIPVRFASGRLAWVQLRFLFDEEAGEWVPESSTTIGFDNPPRVYF